MWSTPFRPSTGGTPEPPCVLRLARSARRAPQAAVRQPEKSGGPSRASTSGPAPPSRAASTSAAATAAAATAALGMAPEAMEELQAELEDRRALAPAFPATAPSLATHSALRFCSAWSSRCVPFLRAFGRLVPSSGSRRPELFALDLGPLFLLDFARQLLLCTTGGPPMCSAATSMQSAAFPRNMALRA